MRRRFPTKLFLKHGRIDCIACIVSQTVYDACYQTERIFLGVTKQTVDGLDDNLDDIYVLPLVETADIVCLGYLAFVENHVYISCIILNEKPVSNILPLPYTGNGFC